MRYPETPSGAEPDTPLGLAPQQQLIKTRLLVPAPRARSVARPRLIERLNASLEQALTLLSAPAGFGKTALLADWSAQAARPVAWLALSAAENDPARFSSYLALALQSAFPPDRADAFAPLLAALYAPQPPPLPAVLAMLLNLLTDLARPLALILDDYQHLASADIHQAVTTLVEHRPPMFHLFIATRSDPPLPLARWRAHDQLAELRAADLQFSTDETAAFLNQVMALELTPEQVSGLTRRTEGWVAGLQMAALSLRGRPDPTAFIQAFSGSHRYILEYLMEEVLDQLPGDQRSFLLHTSMLDRLCGPLCDAVLTMEPQSSPPASSQATLEQLEQANLFLFSLDDDRRWYRYHTLFADLLQARLQQTQPAELPELHTRASRWFARQGLVEEAVQHAFAAGNLELAAAHIEQHAMLFLTRGEMVTLLDWIRQLPEEFIRSRPALGAQAAWALVFAGNFAAARARLQEVHQALSDRPTEDSKTRILRGEAAIMSAVMAEIEGDLSQAVTLAEQADALLPQDDLMARSVIPFVLGDSFYALGDLEQAGQAYMRIQEIGRASGNLWTQTVALGKLANLDRLRGQLQPALKRYRQAIALADEQGGRQFGTMGPIYTGLSEVLHEQNDLAAAQAWSAEALACMALWSSPTDQAFGYLAQAQVDLSTGDLPAARMALQQAAQIAAQQPVFPIVHRRLEGCRLRLWLAAGELDQVAAWVVQAGPDLQDTANPPAIQQELRAILLARALLALGRPAEAVRLLEWLAAPLEAGSRFGRLIEALILLALAYRAQLSLPLASAVLNKALALAEPGGYVRLFLEAGPPLAELLAGLADEHRAVGAYAARLLAQFASHAETLAVPDAQAGLVERLTPREQEVLLLLCQGLSNDEIADRLVISIYTVKKHIGNIYGKLGVTHRAQAVARAHELGLVHD